MAQSVHLLGPTVTAEKVECLPAVTEKCYMAKEEKAEETAAGDREMAKPAGQCNWFDDTLEKKCAH